jgi:hypothetical protein
MKNVRPLHWTIPPQTPPDAADRARQQVTQGGNRPELQKTPHDQSQVFSAPAASAVSAAVSEQPNGGRISGFDFYRDPLNAERPNVNPEDVMKKEMANKAGVMNAQRQLLERRYLLEPKTDPAIKMSRGKPVPVGPTARLASGVTWDQLSALRPDEIRQRGIFPYPTLPHPLHANGGQVFPKMQVDMFPRLERFDVDFDLPDAFLPEFPPAIFLANRPELGDVSRGEVVSINNYYKLFKDVLTPVQLDGLRLLLTPFSAGGVQPNR